MSCPQIDIIDVVAGSLPEYNSANIILQFGQTGTGSITDALAALRKSERGVFMQLIKRCFELSFQTFDFFE